MNQKGFATPILIGIIIIALVGIGAAALALRQNSGDKNSELMYEDEMHDRMEDEDMMDDHDEDDQDENSSSGSFTGTITDLLEQGDDITCTFTRTDTAGTIDGTVYVDAQERRIRGDFTINQTGIEEVDGHVIRDGSDGYFWTDQNEQITKTSIVSENEPPSSTDRESVLDEAVDYTCDPWIVDSSMFELPAGKEIIDITSQVQQIDSANQDIQEAQCAACNQLEAGAKEQCLAALAC